MVPVIDSHCHLDFDDFAKDLPAVLERARQAGLVAMICVGSGADLATAQRAADLADREPDVFAAVGIHPHDAAKIEDDWWPALNKLAQSPRVVAVGETGLDYFYDHSPRDKQAEVFRRFLGLSRSAHRPFVCHVRDAHEDALAILRAESPGEAGGVVHCFSGNLDHARGYLDLDLDLSFSGILTFKNADEIRRVAAELKTHAGWLRATQPAPAKVALTYGIPSQWQFDVGPIAAGFRYDAAITAFHRMLAESGIPRDVIMPGAAVAAFPLQVVEPDAAALWAASAFSEAPRLRITMAIRPTAATIRI